MGLRAHGITGTFYLGRTRDRRSGPYPVLTDWVAFPAPWHSSNFIFSLVRCTFIYVCACRSFCSWFRGRVLSRSGWSETLNVNKADFRFTEICLPLHHVRAVSVEARKRYLITWNWGCKDLWAAHWVLGTEPGSSVRAVSALNHWAIRPVSSES